MNKKCIGILLVFAMLMTGLVFPSTAAMAAAVSTPSSYTEWAFGATYAVGDVVEYDGFLYECLTAHTVSYYDWTPVNIVWYWSNLGEAPKTEDELTSYTDWAYAETYTVGDVVAYEGFLYKCLRAHTAEYIDWTPVNIPAYWSNLGAIPVVPEDSSTINWSDISAVVTASGQNASSMKLANDSQNVYIRIDGNNLGSVGQLFIDSDNKNSTGYMDYQYADAGMDYMIEGATLYSHPSNDNSWNWTGQTVSGMNAVREATYIEYTVPRSILGNEIAVVFKDVTSSYSIEGTLPGLGGYVYYSMGNEEPGAELSTKTFVADDQHVKVTGRTAYIDGKRWLTFSAGKIEFEFYGTAVSIDILGDSTSESSSKSAKQAHIGIELDGERVIDTMITSKNNTFEVLTDEGQAPAWHTVSVMKLSEVNQSCCAITGITTKSSGDIRPTQDKDLYIEFIGDSITCGYGVLGASAQDPFLTETEDASLTYAAVCSRELNADFSCVSCSGYGVYSGSCDGENINLVDLLPPVYDKLAVRAFQYGSSSEETNVYNRTRAFDVCVINLGTNDGTYTHPWDSDRVAVEDRVNGFLDAYKEFLGHVREMNPDAKIVCTLGLMDDALCTTVEKAVEQYKNETGDTEVYYTKLPASPTYGSGYHPSKEGHEAGGKQLATFINSILN